MDPRAEKLIGKFHYDRYLFLFMPVIEFILYPHALELRDTPKLGSQILQVLVLYIPVQFEHSKEHCIHKLELADK